MERLKLRGRIVEKYKTVGAFASEYGITPQTVGNVVSGRSTPKGMALAGWLAALDIPKDQAYIFFAEGLENQTEE